MAGLGLPLLAVFLIVGHDADEQPPAEPAAAAESPATTGSGALLDSVSLLSSAEAAPVAIEPLPTTSATPRPVIGAPLPEPDAQPRYQALELTVESGDTMDRLFRRHSL
ncbi:MAG: hypothetical protein AAFX58_11970, partial [Pseudomonadota bacterium]